MRRLATLPLLLLLLLDWVESSCKDRGFTSDLKCSSCDRLSDHNLDTELFEECKSCCEKDQLEETLVKFASATLKVCGWKLGRFPQIKQFVNDEKSTPTFHNLNIEYARGAMPTLILMNETGEEVETLDLVKWDTETVREYLTKHLDNEERDNEERDNEEGDNEEEDMSRNEEL